MPETSNDDYHYEDFDDGDDLDDCGMFPDGGVFVCGQVGSEPCEFCPNRRYLGTPANDAEQDLEREPYRNLSAEPLLAEYVDEGNWGNFALCGRCGERCGRDSGCQTCDGTAEVAGEKCEDCLDGERWWCDHCGEIEGWLPKGQCAPSKSPPN